jgi:tetratricopeptide (TPR) repeat protein
VFLYAKYRWMILRLSSPAARAFLILLGALFAATFSYSGIRNALAVHYADSNTLEGVSRATRLAPDDDRNWYLLGRYWQYNLEEPDTQRAIHAYLTTLSLDPHSADAWLDLGTAYETEGDVTAARNAFIQAKRVYPRSPDVSWRYGNFLLRRGELNAAFSEIKNAVESDPKRGAAAFVLAMRFEPDINAVLDRILPHSQDVYLGLVSALSQQDKTDQALLVWARLADLRPHLQINDSHLLLDALIRKRQMEEAQRVWEQTIIFAAIARSPDPPGSLVWDGGFESKLVNGSFTWRYQPFANGVQIALDAKEKHSGNQSLRLTFNGLRNVDFNDVCQYITVQPSTLYLFSAWVKTHSLSTDQGVRFGLQSLDGTVSSVAWTEDVRETQPWTRIELPWTSENNVHQLQICISRRPSAKFDSKIGGYAWIDDVILAPESPQSAHS